MKKNLTKKLMLSVLTLAFAVVSLGASTFAWFTLSGSVKVDTFDATITGGYGLDVCVTALGTTATTDSEWKTGVITLADIQEVIGNKAKVFDAVTPDEQKLAANNAKTTFENVSGTAFGADALNTKYIGFNLNFKITDPKSVTEDIYLVLSDLSIYNTVTPTAWTADMGFTVEGEVKAVAGQPYTYNALSAVRFGLVTPAGATIYEQAADTIANVGDNTTGFGDNGAYEYYKKKLNIANPEGVPTSYETIKLEKGTQTVEVDGKKENYVAIKETLNNKSLLINTFEKYATTEDADGKVKVTSNTGEIISVAVYLWVEGWDMECINAIFAQNLSVAMSYSICKKDKDDNYTIIG